MLEFIRVQTAELKGEGSKGFKAVADNQGNNYTMWPDREGYDLVVAGAQIDVEVKVKTKDGKTFKNIMQAQPHEGIPEMIAPVVPVGPDPTRRSIERQTCLKAAVEVVVGTSQGLLPFGKAIDNTVEAAEQFFLWVKGELILTPQQREGLVIPSDMPEPPKNKPPEPSRGTSKPAPKHHWCPIHNTDFFKRGAMKGYAHPLDAGGWCNEEDMKPETDEPPLDGLESAESLGLMTFTEFRAKVDKAFPKWKEDAVGLEGMIGKYLGCPLDQWAESWEVALEELEQRTGKRIG